MGNLLGIGKASTSSDQVVTRDEHRGIGPEKDSGGTRERGAFWTINLNLSGVVLAPKVASRKEILAEFQPTEQPDQHPISTHCSIDGQRRLEAQINTKRAVEVNRFVRSRLYNKDSSYKSPNKVRTSTDISGKRVVYPAEWARVEHADLELCKTRAIFFESNGVSETFLDALWLTKGAACAELAYAAEDLLLEKGYQ
ncbi:conserved hypothetical protein, partial [Ricinus communis]